MRPMSATDPSCSRSCARIELPAKHGHLLAVQQPGNELQPLFHDVTLLPRHLALLAKGRKCYPSIRNELHPSLGRAEFIRQEDANICLGSAGTFHPRAAFVCMSQTVEPPILPMGSPDREANCEVALEAAFAALVTASEAQGWTPHETAAALLKIATERAQQFRLVPTEPPRWQTRRGMLIACAALVFLLCAAIFWWVLR